MISLCNACLSMTKTVKGKCGKCKVNKTKKREERMSFYCKRHLEELQKSDTELIRNRWEICAACSENVKCDAEGNVRDRFPIFKKDEPKTKKRIGLL